MADTGSDTSADRNDVRSRVTTGLIGVIAAILIVWFLRAAYAVLMPVVASAFVAMVVWPLHTWLVRFLPRRLRWAGAPLTTVAVLATILCFAGAVSLALGVAAQRAPQYGDQVQERWEWLTSWAASHGVPIRQMAVGHIRDQVATCWRPAPAPCHRPSAAPSWFCSSYC